MAHKKSELLRISVDSIKQNPENPRLIFDQEKLDLLAESISEVGILVALTVYEDDDGQFVLLDGERRWRCAIRLNLPDVPANIVAKPSKIQNILTMFHIHNVREEWELMPTALKLTQIMDELNTTNERKLSQLTSLSISIIRRCKVLMDIPRKYQKALLNREFKADFFIEMDKVLRKLERNLPELYDQYGKDRLIDMFVEMLEKGKIKSVTDFRLFSKVVDGEKIGIEPEEVQNLVENVILDQEMDFEEAFEVIEDIVNISKVEQKATRLSETFRSFRYTQLKFLGGQEKKRLKEVLTELKDTIDEILREL